MDFLRSVLDKAQDLLQGEPLRAISYGAGVIIYVVGRVSGNIADVSLDQALLQAAGALAVLVSVVETARRLVSSPNTVEQVAAEAYEAGVRDAAERH